MRTLLKRPGFTTLVVLTVALGIGASATIFSIVNAYYLRPLPFREPDRLVYLTDVQPGNTRTPASFPEFEDYRSATNLFENVTAGFTPSMNLTGRERPARLRVGLVARDYFSVLGVQPVAGRTFSADEHRPGASPVVALSSALWRTEFGSSPGTIGSAVTMDGTRYTVVGIFDGERFDFGSRTKVDAWLPLERDPPYSGRGTHFLSVCGRLKRGVSIEQARSGIAVLAKQLDAKYKTGHGISVTLLHDELFGEARASLLMLLVAAGFLMLIASGNVANLLLARATARGREFAIRLAIGAGRWQLIRQTLAESVCVVFAGGAVGLAFSVWASRALQKLWPGELLRPQNFNADWRVLVFLIGISALISVSCAIGPAFQVSIGSLSERLREGWGHFGGGRNRGRSVLVASEIAVACILLSGASLLLTSFWRVLHVDPGFHPENVLTMRVSLPPTKYKESAQRIAFFDSLAARLRALPGTVAVGAGNSIPLEEGGMNGDFKIVGRAPFPQAQQPVAEKHGVTPDYFRALGIRLIRGRWFTDQDGGPGHRVVIINDAMAKKFWPNEDPVGKHMDLQIGSKGEEEIVGVVNDVKLDSLDLPTRYEGYLPYRQLAVNFLTIVIRTTADPMQLAAAARNQVFAVDPEEPVSNVATMEQVVNTSVAGRRLSAVMVATFAIFALLLATIGIYGVVSYWVSQRTREIGIRSALGAQSRDIFELVIGRGMFLAGCGAAVGVIASLLLTRFMASLLFGVSPQDWVTMTSVPVLLGIVTFVACSVPARRASRVDPVVALRFE
jgi:putative ABC transport system permease protein